MTAFDPSALGLRAAEPRAVATPRESLTQNDFLTLLVTQLRNQDPLNPLDNETFVAQLAQFSTVSGINASNDKLDALARLAQADSRTAAPQWIGRQVTTVDGSSGMVASVGIAPDASLTLTLDSGAEIAAGTVARIF